jgi:hypothetical protein
MSELGQSAVSIPLLHVRLSKRATSRLMRCSKQYLFDHLVNTREHGRRY